MKTEWSPLARRDLREICLRILADNPKAARVVHKRIRSGVLMLQDHPQSGRPGRVPGTRELVVAGTPYLIPYRVVGSILQVLRVYHGARAWPDSFP